MFDKVQSIPKLEAQQHNTVYIGPAIMDGESSPEVTAYSICSILNRG